MLEILKYLKYLPLLAKLKDARAAIEAEKGKPAPVYWSRLVVGPVLAIGGAFVAIHLGITVDQNILDQLSNNIEMLVTAGVSIFGSVMTLVRLFKSKGPNQLAE